MLTTNPENLIREMLLAIGDDPSREGLLETPKRVVKSWNELYAGYLQDPKKILSTCFSEGACESMVVLRGIEFASTCEHHMLPFIGVAHVGYLPHGRVVGLSKLARLVDCFAKRLQIQEKLTSQIAQAIEENLDPKGTAVVLAAHHQCMSCRGVKKQGSTMVTSAWHGLMRTEEGRNHFLSMIGTP